MSPATARCGWARPPRACGRCAQRCWFRSTISDVSGQPLLDHLAPVDVWSAADLVDVAVAWRWTAILAARGHHRQPRRCCGGGGRRRCWPESLLTLMPLVLTGHSLGGRRPRSGHQQPVHPPGGRRAVGRRSAGVVGACDPGRGAGPAADGPNTALAARRFSALALWCFVAMAVSGVLNALVRIQPRRSVTHQLRLVAGGQGRRAHPARRAGLATAPGQPDRPRHRRRCAPTVDPAGADRGRAVRRDVRHRRRVGTHATAARAARSPAPPRSRSDTTSAGPPTVARVLFDWRFDLLFGTAAIVGAAVYLAGVYRLRHRGDAWPIGRTVRLAARLRRPAVHHLIGARSLHAGDVQHAHDRPHAAVHAGAGVPGAGRPGDPGIAGAARPRAADRHPAPENGCWPRCTRGCRSS